MPATPRGITYPDGTGHTRLWEHLQAVADTADTAIGAAAAAVEAAAWTTYTPSLTAATTNPVLGNGSIAGRYVKGGRLCLCEIQVLWGSTSTYGSGVYAFGLPPFAAAVTEEWAGGALVFNGTSSRRALHAIIAASGTQVNLINDAGGRMTEANVLTQVSGGSIRIRATYRTAA